MQVQEEKEQAQKQIIQDKKICTISEEKQDLKLKALEYADILTTIFSYFTPEELGKTSDGILLVCKSWSKLIGHPTRWNKICDELWKGKLFICSTSTRLKSSQLPKDAYFLSTKDSKRNIITLEELISLQWDFKFKYRHNENTVQVCHFQEDYILQGIPVVDDYRWHFLDNSDTSGVEQLPEYLKPGETNYGMLKLDSKILNKFAVPSNIKNDTINNDNKNNDNDDDNNNNNDSINTKAVISKEGSLKQRIRTSFSRLKQIRIGPINNNNGNKNNKNDNNKTKIKNIHTITQGRWIKINEYPPLCVFRTSNWGFLLENKWVTFTSF